MSGGFSGMVRTIFCFERQCSIEVKSPTLEPDFLGLESDFVPN